MRPETARTCCAFAFVAFIVTGIALFAFGVRDFEPFVAIVCLLILAGFIGATQDD